MACRRHDTTMLMAEIDTDIAAAMRRRFLFVF